MTFKSLLDFGDFGKLSTASDRYNSPPMWHSDTGSQWQRGWKGGSKGGGSGTALSALTLLAFLFLLNTMQQSLVDNMTTTMAPVTNGFILKENEHSELPFEKSSEEKVTKINDRILWDSQRINLNKPLISKFNPKN